MSIHIWNIEAWALLYKYGLTLNPSWMCNHVPSKLWDEITYRFPNFNGAIVEV